ncbi:Mpv17/PMP22 family protein [Plectosphaerella cucumerina]|uniref:Mpv17/PMP22 family protein n=1 Tax=Plectosphaerella cucumerina TaxID=40658 RepID=A0A8K0X823_9PEZI|nr:Mpv17/PMP22 family protein [Plectosphaerella cucumerina]
MVTTTILSRTLLRRQAPWLRAKNHRRPQSTKPPSSDGITPKTSTSTEHEIPMPNTVPSLPIWQRLGPLTRAAEGYARAQRKRPYWTQFASALVIYFCADMSAQRMGGRDYSPARTARSLVIGGLSAIPSYRWFVFLSQNFNYAGSRALSLAVKIAVNQACFTPLFNSYFFGMQVLLAGEGLAAAAERIRRAVPTSIVNSCKLWPAVTAFSFTFIPMEYRSVFAGVIAVGWQTYLSFLNRQAEEAEARALVAAPVAAALPQAERGGLGMKMEA